jgi:hypothetical protein
LLPSILVSNSLTPFGSEKLLQSCRLKPHLTSQWLGFSVPKVPKNISPRCWTLLISCGPSLGWPTLTLDQLKMPCIRFHVDNRCLSLATWQNFRLELAYQKKKKIFGLDRNIWITVVLLRCKLFNLNHKNEHIFCRSKWKWNLASYEN